MGFAIALLAGCGKKDDVKCEIEVDDHGGKICVPQPASSEPVAEAPQPEKAEDKFVTNTPAEESFFITYGRYSDHGPKW